MKKLMLLAAIGIGYVLGARAGRARYEQIKHQAQKVWHTAPVQSTVENMTETAKATVVDVAHKAAETAKDAAGAVKDRMSGSDDDALDTSAAVDDSTATTPVDDALSRDISDEALGKLDDILPPESESGGTSTPAPGGASTPEPGGNTPKPPSSDLPPGPGDVLPPRHDKD